MCFSMYEISSLRFILLVAGHSRFLIVDACLRKSFTECFADCLPVNPAGPVLGGIVFIYTEIYYSSPVLSPLFSPI